MEFVQPIRDEKQIQAMKDYLSQGPVGKRDCLLFTLGINSGLRISDLLTLKISHVIDPEKKVLDRIKLKEQKTGKSKDFPLGKKTKAAIAAFVATLPPDKLEPDMYLFAPTQTNKPISRVRAWQILNEAAAAVGIKESIGTHTLRKTYGYHLYKKGTDITRIQKLLNHSSPAITLSYIGITRQELDDIILSLNL